MNRLKWALTIFMGLFFSTAWSHMESEKGPHGGYIRMPGAFHTELVPMNDDSFKVYLLDINFKNPAAQESSVEASVKTGGQNLTMTCVLEKESFLCQLPKGASLKKAQEVSLVTVRNKVKGSPAVYEWPLSLEKNKKSH